MQPNKLVYMANQIGKYFAHQGGDRAPASVADHIQKFWEPRMRHEIVRYVSGGGGGLDPFVKTAIGIVAQKLPKAS